jgi:hypothetical protein
MGLVTPRLCAGGEPRYEMVEFMKTVSSADICATFTEGEGCCCLLGLRTLGVGEEDEATDFATLDGGLEGTLNSSMSSQPDLSSTVYGRAGFFWTMGSTNSR